MGNFILTEAKLVFPRRRTGVFIVEDNVSAKNTGEDTRAHGF